MKMSIHTLNPVHLHRAAPLSGRKRAVNNLPAQSTPCRQRNRHPSEDHNFCLHSYFFTIKTDLKSLCSGAFNGTLGFAPIDQTKITIPPPTFGEPFDVWGAFRRRLLGPLTYNTVFLNTDHLLCLLLSGSATSG